MPNSPKEKYDFLLHRTGLIEYQRTSLDGMDCRYCKNTESGTSYILVYEDVNNLSQLISDDKAFASFNRNLYLHDIKSNASYGEVFIVYIVSDDATNIPIQKVEANKTYARKYVLFQNEAITFINGVRSDTHDGLKVTEDPVHVWADILGKVGLTGCLTELFFGKNVSAYLQGEDFNSLTLFEEQYDVDVSESVPQIKWVKSLEAQGFRDFCFDGRKFNFGQINLFYGANGAGKSSVLEAIEFALTSDIKRMTDFKVKQVIDMCPLVDVYDREAGIIHFTPKYANKKAKQIEKSWYGVPVGRNKATLSRSFARFNSFDSEAAYDFIHNTDSSSSSFSVAFGNLMFGENVVDYEKKWKRYRTAFDDSLSSLIKEIPELEFSLAAMKELLDSSESVNLSPDIETTLTRLGYKKTAMLPSEIIMRYNNIVAEFSMVEEVIKPFDDLQNTIDRKVSSVLQGFEVVHKKCKELNERKTKISQDIETRHIELRNLAAKQMAVTKEYETANQKYSAIFTSECNRYSSERILAEKKILARFDKLSEQSHRLERKLESIATLKENHYVNSLFSRNNISAVTNREIDEAKSKKEAAESILVSYETTYSEKKSLMSSQEAELLEIKRLGKILSINGKCPLCGHEYSDSNELMRLIDISGSIDSGIARLLENMATQKAIINQCELILQSNAIRNSAITALKEMSGLVPEIDEMGMSLERIVAFVASEDNLIAELNEVKSRLSTLKKQGFSFIEVTYARNYKFFDKFYREYDAIQGKKKEYDKWISSKREAASKELDKWQSKLNNIEEKRVSINNEIKLLQLEIEKVNIQLQGIPVDVVYAAEAALKSIGDYFEIPVSKNLLEWIMDFRLLQKKVIAELSRVKTNTDYGMAKLEKARLSDAIALANKQKERAENAIAAFDRMPSLSSFVEESIRENIDKISIYFRRMHHSGEFTSLGVDSNGIYAIRGLTNEKVRTYEMSTGQRSAMALSVMLAFHTTALSAPKFLLLDEPLATMDDIQVLNVLDILRSLAQSGIQIFFTTANEQMIRHFKQAFANTDFEYKEYEFIKRIGSTSIITEKSVNETQTIEELTMDDISLDYGQFAEIRRILARNQAKLTSEES